MNAIRISLTLLWLGVGAAALYHIATRQADWADLVFFSATVLVAAMQQASYAQR